MARKQQLQRPAVLQERCRGRSRSVAVAGSGALQRTGALQRPGMWQGQDQERCSVQVRCSVGNVARPNMTKWSPSMSTWQNPSKIDQTYRAPGAPARMTIYWPEQQQWPGSSSCSVRQCCRNVAGAGSGALQGQDQERCSVQERCSALECCKAQYDQMVTKQVNLAES